MKALTELETDYRFAVSPDHTQYFKDARRAVDEVQAQLSPESAESYIRESVTLMELRRYCHKLLPWERSKKLMTETPADIAACKDEIRDSLDAMAVVTEWANRPIASKCKPE